MGYRRERYRHEYYEFYEVEEEEVEEEEPEYPLGFITLTRDAVLDLNWSSESLKFLKFCMGWNANDHDDSYDINMVAFLLDEDGRAFTRVYYNNWIERGCKYNGNPDTEPGQDDNEMIVLNLERLPEKTCEVVISLIIYNGFQRRQYFSDVEDIYFRLDDGYTNKELCRYDITEDGAGNTALTVARIYKTEKEGHWALQATGEFSVDDIESLYKQYRFKKERKEEDGN